MYKSFILALSCLLLSSALFATPSSGDTDQVIYQLKQYVMEYNDHRDDQGWLMRFEEFLKNKVVELNFYQRKDLIDTVCIPREKIKDNDCTDSSMGFYPSAVGAKNVLHAFREQCSTDPESNICLDYQRMLQSDIGQLKFMLKAS